MTVPTSTVFCQEADQLGTIHIDSIEPMDLDSAIQAGCEQWLADRNGGSGGEKASFTLEVIHCLGVAEADVTLFHWEDQAE